MAVEFDVKGTRTSEYLFAPEDIEAIAELNGRHELPDVAWIIDSILKHGQLQPDVMVFEIHKDTIAAIRAAVK